MKKKQQYSLGRTTLLLSLILTLYSCTKEQTGSNDKPPSLLKEDLFPEKVEVKYAKGFEVKYSGNYKVVKLFNPYKNSRDTLTYILLQRGTQKPAGYKGAQFVEVPIKTFACVYTTHVAFTDILESNDIITGFASPEYIINPYVKKGLKDGRIISIGQPDNLNQEVLIALNPQVLMITGGMISNKNKYDKLIQSGISVLVNAEWLETSPLGRAEWFKLMAVFLNKEGMANQKFNHIEKEYLRLKTLTQNVKEKPSVLTGLSYKDAWYIPGGKSFMSHFIKDAGATYPWITDSTTASFPLNFENVYARASTVDFWINPEHATSLEDLLNQDKRYTDFKPFKTGKIYANNNRTSSNGAREFWETGIVNPHIILADLIKIFHPELLPDHDLYYYKALK